MEISYYWQMITVTSLISHTIVGAKLRVFIVTAAAKWVWRCCASYKKAKNKTF